MPIYEYTCGDCGREFEVLVRGREQPVCPGCGKPNLAKRPSVAAAHSSGSAQSACPARDSCGMTSCGGGSCPAAEWL
jgi:putative FmdB family regulatory protein